MDFDSLAFVQEGHFMSNKKCDLPKGSHRTAFKARQLTLASWTHSQLVFLQLTKWGEGVFLHKLSIPSTGVKTVLVLCRDMRRCMCLH